MSRAVLSASSRFQQRADAQMRPIAWSLFISFARQLNASATFFTVGVSSVGGPDPIKGTDSVLQQWDKYQYFDYSRRVVSMEWEQAMDPLYSVQSAMGDLVLDNHDSYLSADNFALPFRPVRIGAGFGNALTGDIEILPQFVGLTEKAPVFDAASKKASYHVVDFLASLYDRPLTRVVLLTNVRTDQAIDALFQAMGLSPTQYDLDVGFNFIPFLYFDTDVKLGDAVQQLMQAEMGRLFMTETGRITFWNRQHFSSTSVAYFDGHNVIGYQTREQDSIINVVEIKSNVRIAQSNQPYWLQTTYTEIPPSSSVDIWANFDDPVVTVDTPVEFNSASTSYWRANTNPNGDGTSVASGITVSTTQFATSYKMTFINSNTFAVYVITINLYATPAPIVRKIFVRQQDDTSVAKYDERVLTIENDFFIDEATATSKAKMILADNKDFGAVTKLTVKGNPALQVNDPITLSIRKRTYVSVNGDTLASIATAYGTTLLELQALNPTLPTSNLGNGTKVELGVIPETVVITGIARRLETSFTQELTVRPISRVHYFAVGISAVGSTDVIAP